MLKEKRRRAGGAQLAAPPSNSGEAELEAKGAPDGVQAGQAGVATAGELAVEAFAVQATRRAARVMPPCASTTSRRACRKTAQPSS